MNNRSVVTYPKPIYGKNVIGLGCQDRCRGRVFEIDVSGFLSVRVRCQSREGLKMRDSGLVARCYYTLLAATGYTGVRCLRKEVVYHA